MKKKPSPVPYLHLFSKPMDPNTLEYLSDVWSCRFCGTTWDAAMKVRTT